MTGQPTYIELGVPDADRARAFYGVLLGWQVSGGSGAGSIETSSLLHVGLHSDDPGAELLVFFAVDDLNAALEELDRAGGARHGDVVEEARFGRFAICSDDQGVRFGLHERTTVPR